MPAQNARRADNGTTAGESVDHDDTGSFDEDDRPAHRVSGFSRRQIRDLIVIAKQEPELSRLAQFARDYEAFGRAGGFLGTIGKWLIGLGMGLVALRSGLLDFLGISGL